MTRIERTFDALKKQHKKALIPYIMAGDPNPSITVDLMHKLVKHGADVIEIGLPFSDPMADGKTIAIAGERALAGGTSTKKAIEMVAEFRKKNQETPVLLMGYLNPVEMIGYDEFVQLCSNSGVDGLLLVDLPPHETSDHFSQTLKECAINQIFLLSPTTQAERQASILKRGSGFIYYVSLKGVTGSASLDTTDVCNQVQNIKAQTHLPVCVGFGIRDAASAQAIAKSADGVIVGSELVRHFADVGNDSAQIEQAIAQILAKMDELRQAIDHLPS